MNIFKTICPAIILTMAVGSAANAQAFGVVQTGGAVGVGSGAAPVAATAAGAGAVTGFAPLGLGGLAGGSIGLGLGAIVAVGAIASGGDSSVGTN